MSVVAIPPPQTRRPSSPLDSVRRTVRLLPRVQAMTDQWRICLSNLEVKRQIHEQIGREISELLDVTKQIIDEHNAPTLSEQSGG